MMEPIRQYVLSVICMTVMSGIVQQLLARNPHIGIIKVITGLIVTVTVLNPFLHLEELSFDALISHITADGDWAVEAGEEAAANMTSKIITDRVAAYICNKASAYGASVDVEVELDQGMPPKPTCVTVKGPLSPYIKQQISDCIQRDLGISGDAQIWIS